MIYKFMKYYKLILFFFLLPIHLCLLAQNDIQNYKIKVAFIPFKFEKGNEFSDKQKQEYEEYFNKTIPYIFDSLQKYSKDMEFIGKVDSTILPQSNLLLLQQGFKRENAQKYGLGDSIINVLTHYRIDGYTKQKDRMFSDLDFKFDSKFIYENLQYVCLHLTSEIPYLKPNLEIKIKNVNYVVNTKKLKEKNKLEKNLNFLFDKTLFSYRVLNKTFLLTSKDDKKLIDLIKDKMLLKISYQEQENDIIFEIKPKSKKFIPIDIKGNIINTSFKIDKKRFESGDYLEFNSKVFITLRQLLK